MRLFMLTFVVIIILAIFLAEGSADSLKDLTVSDGFNPFSNSSIACYGKAGIISVETTFAEETKLVVQQAKPLVPGQENQEPHPKGWGMRQATSPVFGKLEIIES